MTYKAQAIYHLILKLDDFAAKKQTNRPNAVYNLMVKQVKFLFW